MTGTSGNHYWMRPFEQADLALVARWFEQLEDLAMFDRRIALPMSTERFQSAWRDALADGDPHSSYWFTIIDGAEGETVGVAGLQDINYVHGDAVFPIYLAAPLRLKGIGTRVGATLLDLAFSHLRLRRVTSFCRADNHVSHCMTRTLGFREEGRLREAWFAEGQHFDITVIGLLREEWQTRREELKSRLTRDVVVRLGRAPLGTWCWPPEPVERLEPATGG